MLHFHSLLLGMHVTLVILHDSLNRFGIIWARGQSPGVLRAKQGHIIKINNFNNNYFKLIVHICFDRFAQLGECTNNAIFFNIP